MKRVIIILLVVILVFLGLTITKYLLNTKSYVILDLNYSESTNTIQNPERGFYFMNSCMVNDEYDKGNAFLRSFEEQKNAGDTLVMLLFNISNYRDREISKEGLKYISNVLQNVQKTGMKAIVRFVYDWDGKGMEKEPDNITMVLKHMEQLSLLLHSNKDVIYLLQGIFVGSYGEMHGSKHLGNDDVAALINKFLSCTDESTILSVRTPAYWRMFSQRNNPVDSFSQLPWTRVGLYNDGLCSSEIDLGTYSDGTDGNNGYMSKWERQKELEFQSKLCQFVPNGGELALDSEYNNPDRIVREFPMLHISYLNRGYNDIVLEKWKKSSYAAQSKDDPYNGLNGYKYVQDHLGYRFVLREVSIPRNIYLKTSATIKVKIENTGFANFYQKKNISLVLKGIATGEEITVPVDIDARLWKAKSITEVKIKLPAPNLKKDTYKLYLKIYDDSRHTIQMANNNIYDENLEANAIGEIQMQSISLEGIWK